MGIGVAPLGADYGAAFPLRDRVWNAAGIFDASLSLRGIFDKAAVIAVATEPED